MINRLQIYLYKVSYISPLLIMIGISLLLQDFIWKWYIPFLVIGIITGIYAFVFIRLCLEKLPSLPVTVESIAPDDRVIIAYLSSHLVPLIGVIWQDNIIIRLAIGIMAVIFLFMARNIGFCPVLLLGGYHCYQVSLSTGVQNCILISTRPSIRSINQISTVVRVCDSLLIDEGGKRNV